MKIKKIKKTKYSRWFILIFYHPYGRICGDAQIIKTNPKNLKFWEDENGFDIYKSYGIKESQIPKNAIMVTKNGYYIPEFNLADFYG